MNAIEERRPLDLHALIDAGEIHAFTATQGNVTLLLHCVAADFPQGFEALASAINPADAPELNRPDTDLNTLLHCVAMHADDADFHPDVDSDWERVLRNLLEDFGADVDFNMTNDDGITADASADLLNKPNLAAFLRIYI